MAGAGFGGLGEGERGACEDTAVGLGGVGGWDLIPLGAWLVSCVLLVLAHFATRSSAARRQRRWVGGCARRRWHNFGQRVL